MPRCYKVSVTTEDDQQNEITHVQFAGTQAESRMQRDEFVKELGVKKKDVQIEEADIPYGKGDLIMFINQLIKKV